MRPTHFSGAWNGAHFQLCAVKVAGAQIDFVIYLNTHDKKAVTLEGLLYMLYCEVTEPF